VAATRKRGSRKPGLDTALEALEAGDDAAALDALLVAWRASRAPRIAELVGSVSKRIEARQSPIDEHRDGVRDYWMAIARQRRATDLPRLLADVPHKRSAPSGPAARISTLAQWPHDPRVTPGVVRLLERPKLVASIPNTCAYLARLVELAVAQDDPATLGQFEELADRLDQILHSSTRTAIRVLLESAIADALERLHARPNLARRRASDAAACARIERHLERVQGSGASLFAEIAANPADDAPRQVLADHLLERGDPRGEFIALQLSGTDPAREHALVAKHAKSWLGPLAGVVAIPKCRFERGFLVETTIDTDATEPLRRVIGDPAWSTVERLRLGMLSSLPAELLLHPVMRVQHLLELEREVMLELLAWKHIPYTAITADFPHRDAGFRGDDVDVLLGARAALAQLRVLGLMGSGIEPQQFRWIWKSWLDTQLDHLELRYGLHALDRWLDELNTYANTIPEVRLGGQEMSAGWLALTRDAKRRFSIGDLHTPTTAEPRDEDLAYSVVGSYIAALPRGTFTRLRIHDRMPRPKYRRVLEAACARAKLPLELPPEQRKRRR
jgi:uncharacterized protein (TIGR02996 family)